MVRRLEGEGVVGANAKVMVAVLGIERPLIHESRLVHTVSPSWVSALRAPKGARLSARLGNLEPDREVLVGF